MNVELQASDGHRLSAYLTSPATPATKAVVIVQEIFGVNKHIRAVTDEYARDGFLAVAPALFDRVERDLELDYLPPDRQRGFSIATQIGMETALRDIAAAVSYATEQVGAAHVGVVGFCWGGSLAWLAATRLRVGAVVAYYGGRIAEYADEQPHCPVMLHFGSRDAHIPESEIDKIRSAHPEIPIHLYDAGHGFNCDYRQDYEPNSAALARQRTLAFLDRDLDSH